MNDCALFADTAYPEEVNEALQNKLNLIESWARLSRISLGAHKCFLLPHKLRAKPSLTFFGEPIPCKNEVTYLGVKFRSSARIGLPLSLKLHLNDLGNAICQKSHILLQLRCTRLKIPASILRFLFQGWIGGLVWFFLSIFSDTADEDLEISFRFALRPLWDSRPLRCSKHLTDLPPSPRCWLQRNQQNDCSTQLPPDLSLVLVMD